MSEGGHLPCPGVGIGQAGAAYKRRSKRPVAWAGASAYENNLATITQEEDRQRPGQVLILILLILILNTGNTGYQSFSHLNTFTFHKVSLFSNTSLIITWRNTSYKSIKQIRVRRWWF